MEGRFIPKKIWVDQIMRRAAPGITIAAFLFLVANTIQEGNMFYNYMNFINSVAFLFAGSSFFLMFHYIMEYKILFESIYEIISGLLFGFATFLIVGVGIIIVLIELGILE